MSIGNKLRYQVLRRDNYTCRYCGAYAPFARLVVDHVTPRKHGGPDVAENLVTACEPCNSGKSASLPESWLVAEVEATAREWQGIAPPEPDEDDLRAMETYQESLYELEALPAAEALHWIAQAYITVAPYRPSLEELINGAAGIAQHRSAEWREQMNASQF